MWPIATSPGSACSCCSLKTCATRPISRTTVRRPPSDTAIPADSWPRCWSANSPKYARRATSRSSERIPKTPHIRLVALPGAVRSCASSTPSRVPPPAAPIRRSGTLNSLATASISDAAAGAHETTARPPTSPKSSTGSSRRSSTAPEPEKSAASARHTASPPSEASWTSVAQRGGLPEERDEPRLGVEVERRRRSAHLAVARLVLGAGERTASRRTRRRSRRPSRQPLGTRRTSSTRPTAPTTGVGWIARPFVSL